MQIYSFEGASTPLFVDVLDELLPEENGDDDLDEVDPASLPPARQRGKAKCGECDMICRYQYLLEKHIKARHDKKPWRHRSLAPTVERVLRGRQHDDSTWSSARCSLAQIIVNVRAPVVVGLSPPLPPPCCPRQLQRFRRHQQPHQLLPQQVRGQD